VNKDGGEVKHAEENSRKRWMLNRGLSFHSFPYSIAQVWLNTWYSPRKPGSLRTDDDSSSAGRGRDQGLPNLLLSYSPPKLNDSYQMLIVRPPTGTRPCLDREILLRIGGGALHPDWKWTIDSATAKTLLSMYIIHSQFSDYELTRFNLRRR
jgi:hypothetical protein